MEYAQIFGMDSTTFISRLDNIEPTYEGASDTPRNKAKGRLITLSNNVIVREISDICRRVASKETERQSGEMEHFMEELVEQIQAWRSEQR